MLHNINFNVSGLILRIVLEWLVIISSNSKHVLWAVYVIAEVNVINFIDISHIHIVLKYQIHDIIWSLDA